MQQEGKGICSPSLVLWIQGRRFLLLVQGFQQDHTPRILLGQQERCWRQGIPTFPWNGKCLSGRKESLAGVSARAEEGRESSLGISEQERARSCTPVFSSWISGRKGKLGMRNGSGRGAGLLRQRAFWGKSVRNVQKSPLLCLALLSSAAVHAPLTPENPSRQRQRQAGLR